MTAFRNKLVSRNRTAKGLLLTIATLVVLSACSSKQEIFVMQQEDSHWYCTPKNNGEWRCQESAHAYRQLAEEGRLKRHLQLEQKEIGEPSQPDKNIPEDKVRPEDSETTKIEVPAWSPSDSDAEQPVLNRGTNRKAGSNLNPNISPWVVQLAAYSDLSGAKTLMQTVIGSQYFMTRVKGRDYFTVVILGFEQRQQAQAAADNIRSNHNLEPWIRSGRSFKKVMIQE